ncbi:MAG: glycerol-3-phosphate acyltransferase [candidate division WOR-3 bacterium]|nr:glycerol-3-phosphate acyltransferase [candidate division WOR-3 bacterium]
MNQIVRYLSILVVSYLIGAFPSGYVFYKLNTGKDIRDIGLRKNMGSTNVFVNGGVLLGTLTLIFDISKGAVPVLIAGILTGSEFFMILCGAAAILGHVFPVYIGFRGGTGLATSLGALITLIPGIMITYAVIFAVLTPVVKRPAFIGLILMVLIPFVSYMLGYSMLITGICTLMGICYAGISMTHIESMLRGDEYQQVMKILKSD